MNELEKMINGLEYCSGDKDLEMMRDKAKDLCLEYNLLKSNQTKEKEDIIKKLFGKIGKDFGITAPFYCDYGFNIEAGDNFYVNYNCIILDCAKVKFGDNVFIAPNCGFYTAGHPIDIERKNPTYRGPSSYPQLRPGEESSRSAATSQRQNQRRRRVQGYSRGFAGRRAPRECAAKG